MRNKLYWGFGILVIIILGLSVALFMRNTDTEPEVIYNPTTPEDMEQVNRRIQDMIDKGKPPTARPGYKLVRHGDHYHEVPIVEVENSVQDASVPKTASGGLTYHTELLATNPSEALYQQCLERGHWSSKWIPPFPPEDTEAQELARNIYLRNYYISIDDTQNPIYVQAGTDIWYKLDDLLEMPADARCFDLLKLTWARTSEESIVVDWADPSHFSLPRTDR